MFKDGTHTDMEEKEKLSCPDPSSSDNCTHVSRSFQALHVRDGKAPHRLSSQFRSGTEKETDMKDRATEIKAQSIRGP